MVQVIKSRPSRAKRRESPVRCADLPGFRSGLRTEPRDGWKLDGLDVCQRAFSDQLLRRITYANLDALSLPLQLKLNEILNKEQYPLQKYSLPIQAFGIIFHHGIAHSC